MTLSAPQAHPNSVLAPALMYAEQKRVDSPADWYVAGDPNRFPDPLDRFPLQFHSSTHMTRAMVLGNDAVKTTVAGVDVDLWIHNPGARSARSVPPEPQSTTPAMNRALAKYITTPKSEIPCLPCSFPAIRRV